MWRAVVLVIVAGFVDAVGFLALAGTFVAFMSGNTSAGGALAGTLDVRRAARQLFPLPFFVAGIYLGALVVQSAAADARRRRYAVVLGIECGLIALVLGAATVAGLQRAIPIDPPARFFALAAPLALAMGLQNAMRMDIRGANLATTYVTGTLHVAAQALARATVQARNARRVAQGATHAAGADAAQEGVTALVVWAGFLIGAIGGGWLFAYIGLAALLLPMALLLGLMADILRHRPP